MLTFNLEWNVSTEKSDLFTDIRDLQKQLIAQKGINILSEADEIDHFLYGKGIVLVNREQVIDR